MEISICGVVWSANSDQKFVAKGDKKMRLSGMMRSGAVLCLGVFVFISAAVAETGSDSSGFRGLKTSAQNYGMSWSGNVDNLVQISIRGRSASVRTLEGQRVRNVNYNFQTSLPNREVNVEVRKRDGRGSVKVIQQPARFNNYTAIVEIHDSSGGSDNYRFDLTWENRFGNDDGWFGNNNGSNSSGPEMTWSGNVDDVIRISISGRRARVSRLSGRSPYNIRTNFDDALPRNNVVVTLRKREGRGSVRIIEQPRANNGYTAVVEIDDSRGGSDFYSFELNWNRNIGNNRNGGIFGNNNRNNRDRGDGMMTWSGTVDDRVQIIIRGRSVSTRTISGQRLGSGRYNMSSSLPNRNVNVRVDKTEGRGSVRVIQQPSRSNNYTAIVEIRDSSGGRDNYAFELEW
ncbi:MAG: hypothetical protein R2681_11690 [Pyrinomonadaceae bacterium]